MTATAALTTPISADRLGPGALMGPDGGSEVPPCPDHVSQIPDGFVVLAQGRTSLKDQLR